MSNTHTPPGPWAHLTQATTVLLLFQTAFLFSQLYNDGPYSGSMTAILAATLTLSVVDRRLMQDPQGRHASGYIIAWRYGGLALLGVLSVIVALRAYAPQVTPNQMPTLIIMLFAAVIALKGALLGKLKPGGVLGLRVRWTCRSRLAWEKAHRLMGRILFIGGLLGLAAAPFAPPLAAFVWIFGVIAVGIAAGTIESWRVWRNDPERRTDG